MYKAMKLTSISKMNDEGKLIHFPTLVEDMGRTSKEAFELGKWAAMERPLGCPAIVLNRLFQYGGKMKITRYVLLDENVNTSTLNIFAGNEEDVPGLFEVLDVYSLGKEFNLLNVPGLKAGEEWADMYSDVRREEPVVKTRKADVVDFMAFKQNKGGN